MRPSTTVSKLAEKLSWLVAAILVLMPFHAFLSVWLASGTGHYILVRLWKEVLLLILVGSCFYLLIANARLRKAFFESLITRLIMAYCLFSLVLGVTFYGLHKVTAKAFGYGLIVNLRFLIFFLAVSIVAALSPRLKALWPKLLWIPASAVLAIGLLQRLVLPYDVLKHFGYGSQTIFPYETINHNIHYPRIMSTLRGANPLGSYLVLVATAIAGFFVRAKKHRLLLGSFGLAALLVLFFSYSRSAWIGLALGLLAMAWMNIKNQKTIRLISIGLTLLLIFGAGLALALKNNPTFENYLLHTQNNSQVPTSSNQGHVSAFKNGLRDILHQPLGRGVGTAGPASIYNNDLPRISENYYIQIGQEVGWLGLALFLAINFLVARALWRRHTDSLAQILLASFIGLIFVNLVSHAWTDDTLAYLWWGLAGIALAPVLVKSKR